jgi:RimJ/RimL family protein N-acetyltransferase
VRGSTAELAWVVGTAYQGRGYATEAATAVRDSLLRGETGTPMVALEAHIAPGHHASEAVAQHLGLTPTDITVASETRWHLPPP